MNQNDLEEIKKSYIYKIAKDTNQPLEQKAIDIKDLIAPLELYIQKNYPHLWVNYMEGKMYSNNNISDIINNILNLCSKTLKQKIAETLPENSNKQVVQKLINNQMSSICKLNTVFEELGLDSKPLIIYLLGYLLRQI